MNVEQIASDFITKMNDVDAAELNLTPDAVAAGGVLPQPIPAKEAISILSALNTAFPDLKFDVQNVTAKGNQATVQAIWVVRTKVPETCPCQACRASRQPVRGIVKDIYRHRAGRQSLRSGGLAARWWHPRCAGSNRRQSTRDVVFDRFC